MLYWLLKSVLLGPFVRAIFRPTVEGLDHVPAAGPAILASNHLSFSDSFFLPLVVPRRITFLAKSDYFTGRGVKGRLTAGFFRGVGQVPVDRSGGQASEGALEAGLKILSRGDLLGIYPEGTRSPDGRLYRGKTGLARMALEARCPIIPVAMLGTDKVQPTGQKIPNLGKVGIVIGEPLDFSRYAGQQDDRRVLRSITDEVMYDLMRLSGQEYVDVYAGTMKDQLAEAVRERITQARSRAQTAATAASARAVEARARVEEARQRMDGAVGEARQRVDATVGEARARVDATVEGARQRVGDAMHRGGQAQTADAEAPAPDPIESGLGTIESGRGTVESGPDPIESGPGTAEPQATDSSTAAGRRDHAGHARDDPHGTDAAQGTGDRSRDGAGEHADQDAADSKAEGPADGQAPVANPSVGPSAAGQDDTAGGGASS
ncbi:MAG: 1-acyl-sn-glycerol-3-phosphate acyltransferase [Actinomycetales bacterium]